MQIGGATDSNNDERVRSKYKRCVFYNGSEFNQHVRSADKTNNDINVGDINAKRRRRFLNGANWHLCIHSLLQIINYSFSFIIVNY